MIWQIGESLPFDFAYVASKLGKTGLVVTIKAAYKNGVAIGALAGVVVPEIGNGLYRYSLDGATYVDAAGDYVIIATTADTSVDQRDLYAVNVVTPWVADVDAAISSIASAVASSSGTIGTADIVDIVEGVSYSTTITGLTISAGWQTMTLTIKEQLSDADTASLVQIVVTNGGAAGDGLVYIQKQTIVDAGLAAATASLTVNQGAGTVAIYMLYTATNKLSDFQAAGFDLVEYDGTDLYLRTSGKVNIKRTETRP